jgi:hypothetical protein
MSLVLSRQATSPPFRRYAAFLIMQGPGKRDGGKVNWIGRVGMHAVKEIRVIAPLTS